MNTGSNYDEIVRRMKGIELPEIDVARRVMDRIHALHRDVSSQVPQAAANRGQRRRGKAILTRPVSVAVIALFFAAAVSVSAAISLPAEWNGIRLSTVPDDGNRPPGEANGPTYKERIEEGLQQSAGVWKTLTLEEAKEQFSFPIIRPEPTEMTLTRTFGVVPREQGYRVQSQDELWLGGFYDYFERGEQWAVVKQNLYVPATEALQNPEETMSLTFEGAWEPVKVTDRFLAMIIAGVHENLLTLQYKTNDRQVISLEFAGNVSKEELIKLAEAYVGQ